MPSEGVPAPPPEAVLLRLVRKAHGVTVAEAARAAGISKAWLSSIENGYDTRTSDGLRPVRASDEIIAKLAGHLGVSAERLETEGQRPDAAAVLREIQRPGDQLAAGPAPDGSGPPDDPDPLDALQPAATEWEREQARQYIENLRRAVQARMAAERDGRQRPA